MTGVQYPAAPPPAPGAPQWAPPPPAPAPRSRPALVAGLVGAVAGAVVAAATVAVLDDDGGVVAGRPAATIPAAEGGAMDIRAVLDAVQASVVTIEVGGGVAAGPFEGAGSGIVISDDGLVLTNAHVVNGASTITVRSFTGEESDAELVGSFPDDDVALVRVADHEGLEPATLGDSSALQVGDEVVAIGNALDLTGQPTVTRGIVSALDREIEGGDTVSGQLISLGNLIQTDAAINPGNSGGPLVASDGTVVAMNTAIISNAQNVGFAIAIDAIKPLIEQIEAGDAEITADTGFLGVETADLDSVAAAVLERFEVEEDEGAFVVDVADGTAAAAAGIQEGDVIVAVDGTAISSSAGLRDEVRSHRAGEDVTVEVVRAGEELELAATLGSITD